MRKVFLLLVLATLCGGAAASGQPEAGKSLLAIRATLGGSAALDGVRTVRLEGTSARIVGPLRLDSRVTMTIVRPDGYLRVDALSLGSRTTETTVGFVGGVAVQSARGPVGVQIDPEALVPADARDQARRAAAQEQRRDLRRLLLGYLAGPFDGTSMTVAARGIAEAPDGQADMSRLAFEDGSEATLFSDTGTHLPMMVAWEGPDVLAQLRSATNRTAGRGISASPPASASGRAEHRFYFADFRAVGTLRWPFVIRHAVAGELIEELRFERVLINPPVDLAVFDGSR